MNGKKNEHNNVCVHLPVGCNVDDGDEHNGKLFGHSAKRDG